MRKLRFFTQCMIIMLATLVTAEWLSKVKQNVAINNIINKFKALSVTSCHLKCKANKKCKAFGMLNNINLGETGKCFLLARDDCAGEESGETKEMYVTKPFSSSTVASNFPSRNDYSSANAAMLDGGGWILVRHAPAGNTWHKATDQLTGTDVYGTPCGAICNEEWSIKFNETEFNQFLFATGDVRMWLIASKDAVTGAFYENALRKIYKSSINQSSYEARWYRRVTYIEDPWISLNDHTLAYQQNTILYGENHDTGNDRDGNLPFYKGVNVFIRLYDDGSMG